MEEEERKIFDGLFGKRLKKFRKAVSMVQEELAEQVRMDGPQISKYENGYLPISFFRLREICSVLRISADELLDLPNITINQNDDPKRVGGGLHWVQIPSSNPNIQMGIELFERIMLGECEDKKHLKNIGGEHLIKMAIYSGGIEIIEVNRNKALEETLQNLYGLVGCIVADIDIKIDENIQCIIGSETVAFLAAQEIRNLVESKSQIKIGVTGGDVIARLVDLLPYGLSEKMEWVPLISSGIISPEFTHTANYVVARAVYRQPGSEGHVLPYLTKRQRDLNYIRNTVEKEQREIKHSLRVIESCNDCHVAMISVGSRDSYSHMNNQKTGLSDLWDVLSDNSEEEKSKCVGDILLYLIDQNGERVGDNHAREMNDDLVHSIGLEGLKKLVIQDSQVWITAFEKNKIPTIHAALTAGIANALIIDLQVAQGLRKLASTNNGDKEIISNQVIAGG